MLHLKTEFLKGALECASTEETRYYLNGVYLERSETGVHIVATDEQIMYVAHQETAPEGGEPDPRLSVPEGGVIIPFDAVKSALRDVKKSPTILVSFAEPNIIGQSVFFPIDGTFPDWRRVIPQETTGEGATFNPKIMLRALKALNYGGRYFSKPALYMNGEGPAVMYGGEAFCVVAPYRNSDGFKPHKLRYIPKRAQEVVTC